MILDFNNGYDFTKEKYYFTINKESLSRYEMDDIEKFIVKNQGFDVESVKIKLQDEFNVNNIKSYSIMWDKIHKLYTRDIIIWKGKNPFEDMYEYNGRNFDFKIEATLKKSYKIYRQGMLNVFAQQEQNYDLDINNVSKKPLKSVIFFSIHKEDYTVGIMTFLLGRKRNSYIIGSINLKDEVKSDVLNNALLWVASRLCLIFGQICKTFEFRIDKKDIDRKEIKKLINSGFKVLKDRRYGIDCLLLEKEI